MAVDTVEVIIRSKATGTGSKQATSGIQKLEKAAKVAAGAFALMKSAQAAVDFVQLGADALRQADALDHLAESAGSSGDAIVEAIQNASDFTIDRMTAMGAANKALTMNVAKTPEEFERMTVVARRLGQAMGQDAAKSIDDFVTAAARQSMQIADNLGLTIKQSEAYELYARQLGTTADALTDAEKKQAFLNAMLVAGEAKVAEMGEAQLDAAAQIEMLTAATADMKVGLAEMAAEALDSLVDVRKFSEGLRTVPDTIRKISIMGKALWDSGGVWQWMSDGGEEFGHQVRMAYFETEEYLDSMSEAADVTDGWMSSMTSTGDAVVETGEGISELTERQILMNRAFGEGAVDAMEYGGELEELTTTTADVSGAFADALRSGESLEMQLYNAAVQAGANSQALALLAWETGEFTRAEIEAALEAAAMEQKLLDLGKRIAAGMSIDDAIAEIDEFKLALDRVPSQLTVRLQTQWEMANPPRALGGGAFEQQFGTMHAAGGIHLVGERGPELVRLPQGAQVWPAGATDAALRETIGTQHNDNRNMTFILPGMAGLNTQQRGAVMDQMGLMGRM